MSIENLYFPIFLVVVGVVVVWLFNKFRDSDSSRSQRRTARKSKADNNHKLQRSLNPSGPAAGYRPNHGLKTQDNMWRSRAQRASHDASKAHLGSTGSQFKASYLSSDNVYGHGTESETIGEQAVRDTEYTGLDEYLTKRAADRKAKKDQVEEELSMTAMKYEPADGSEKVEKPKQQGGFKP